MTTTLDHGRFNPNIVNLPAYQVPNADGMIKLDAMENPYSLPPALKEEIGQLCRQQALNLYPDAHCRLLSAALANYSGLDLEQYGLLVGNGSDELIQALFLALHQPNACILAPEPSFVLYLMIASWLNWRYVGVPLNQDFSLNRQAMLTAIDHNRPNLIFLAEPNNPTGNLFADDDVIAIIEAAPGLVVIDEAYYAFARHNRLALLARYDNVLIMRTLSKLGLAALRCGWLCGDNRLINQINKVRLPYNINSLTQAIVPYLLEEHVALFAEQALKIRQERQRLDTELNQLPGIRALASEANFILLQVDDAQKRFEQLQASGILVKKLHGVHPLLEQSIRLTIGQPDDNDAVLKTLSKPI